MLQWMGWNLFLRICKEFADIFFALTNKFIEDLRPIDNFWFFGIEHFSNLSCHQSLASPRWPIQQDSFGSAAFAKGKGVYLLHVEFPVSLPIQAGISYLRM